MKRHGIGSRARRAVIGLSLTVCALTPVTGLTGAGLPADFLPLLSAVDDEPLPVEALAAASRSPALETFLRTGQNAYRDDAGALREGKARYEQWCQLCHLADASGRMGPSLVDDVYQYKRTDTDHGMFEVIYGGAAGAMQSFSERLTPDEILKVIAYVRSLRHP